jgi:hypothetical protein
MSDLKLIIYKTDNKPYEIDQKYIDSLSTTTEQIADLSTVAYGVVSNYGDITLNDYDNSIYKLVTQKKITSGKQKVEIWYKNQPVAYHVVEENGANYDSNSKTLKLSLTDELQVWDGIYPTFELKSNTLLGYLTACLMAVGFGDSDIEQMCSSKIVVNTSPLTVLQYLSNIKDDKLIGKTNEDNKTVREIVDDICQIAQLSCYIGENGKPKFVSTRPREMVTAKTEKATKSTLWQIAPKNQTESLTSNLLLSNQYDSVSITTYDGENYTTTIYGDSKKDNTCDYSSQNDLLTANLAYYDENDNTSTAMSEMLQKNILEDYNEGKRQGECTVIAMDYYDLLNDTQYEKLAYRGDLLKVGNVVEFMKDNNGTPIDIYHNGRDVYWEIRSRTFDYNGNVKLKLKVQELANVAVDETLGTFHLSANAITVGSGYFRTYLRVSWEELNVSGTIITEDNVRYSLYIGGKLYKTYSSADYTSNGYTYNIDDITRGTKLEVKVIAYDITGQVGRSMSDIRYVTVPKLKTWDLGYKCEDVGNRGVIIPYIPDMADVDSCILYGKYRDDGNSNDSIGNYTKIKTYSKDDFKAMTNSYQAKYCGINYLPMSLKKQSALIEFVAIAYDGNGNVRESGHIVGASNYVEKEVELELKDFYLVLPADFLYYKETTETVADEYELLSNGVEKAIYIDLATDVNNYFHYSNLWVDFSTNYIGTDGEIQKNQDGTAYWRYDTFAQSTIFTNELFSRISLQGGGNFKDYESDYSDVKIPLKLSLSIHDYKQRCSSAVRASAYAKIKIYYIGKYSNT